ncbi:MAG: hypothetical protein WDW38_006565 [Sanguina aurantia]
MEVIAFLTLAAAGYVINLRRSTSAPLAARYAAHRPGPSLDQIEHDVYESRRSDQVRMVEYNAASDAYRKSLFPERDGVIPRNFTDDSVQQGIAQRRQTQANPGVSALSGLPCDFSHANAVPFFGGRVKQPDLDKGNFRGQYNFELFTGTTATGNTPMAAKVESEPLFEPTVGNVYGAPVIDLEEALERLQIGRLKQNERPFEQVTVGPAINGGYNGTTNDSYLAGREYQMPLDTDQVYRTADNPKTSYEGRTIDGGERVASRGLLGEVREMHNPQRYKETFSADDWMKTTGQNLGEASRPEEILRDVTRPCTHVEYTGSAAPTSMTNATYGGQGAVSETRREDVHRLQLGPASAVLSANRAAPLRADYGRANILVYQNERDTTNISVFAGSTSTVVKSIIAPLFDILRPARRQVLGTEAARAFGNVGAGIPSKQTVRDQDGVLRTTIREVTTQFVENPGALGSFKGPALLPVYDPTDVARTTLKEQTIHDGAGAAFTTPAPLTRRTMARDPDDTTRVTVRETLDAVNTSVNPSVPSRGLLLRDPDLHARQTIKETTVTVDDPETSGTAVGKLQGGRGGYTSADMTPFPATIRQFTQDDNRLGGVGGSRLNAGDGYRVAEDMPRDTQKQVLSDNSYYGAGKQQGGGDAPMSHEEYGNATFRPEKEVLAVMTRGDFGLAGVQRIVSKDDVDVGEVRKNVLVAGMEAYVPAVGRIQPNPADASFQGVPEIEGANTCGLDPTEGTRSARGTYSEEMAIPLARFDEDVLALKAQRSSNPTASRAFFKGS